MAPPPDEPLVPVRVVIEGPGAAGAAGGARRQRSSRGGRTGRADSTAGDGRNSAAAGATSGRAIAAPTQAQAGKAASGGAAEAGADHGGPPPEPPPVEVAVVPLPEPAPGAPGTGGGPGAGDGTGQGAAGAGQGAVGDGPVGSPGDDYLERVRRWIKQFQHYPREATRQKQEGTALLDVTLARDGTVLGVALERSSGYPLLDQAAIKAVLDASPVPAFPPAYRREQGTMVLAAQYRLGTFERLF